MPHEHSHIAGEAKHSHAIQYGLFIFFFIVWVLDSFIFPFFWTFYTAYFWSIPHYIASVIGLYPVTFALSFFITIIPGAWIIIIGIYLMQRSHIVFEGKEPQVVDHGVYSRVRHPMYLGSILVYAGFWAITLSLLSLIPLFAVVIGYNYLANVEEQILEEKFGDEYREYKKRVRKWRL